MKNGRAGETSNESLDIKKIKVKKQLDYKDDGSYYFYVEDDEIKDYIEPIISKKIDEVIYALNKEKYIEGIEEFNEFLGNFKDIKKQIINYYSDPANYAGKRYSDTESDLNPYANGIVTSIIKSNLSQEIEDAGNNTKKVTDKFTFTADGTYVTNFTLTYTTGELGKINSSSIQLKYENVTNDVIEGRSTDTNKTGNGD